MLIAPGKRSRILGSSQPGVRKVNKRYKRIWKGLLKNCNYMRRKLKARREVTG
jgi:hypothetical protein